MIKQVKDAMETAFIDSSLPSNISFRPQLVSNNYKEGRKVLTFIEEELLECEQFSISVAFVTMGGLAPLLQTLQELEKRNVSGRILTTDYLNFSEPKALKKLNEFKNIKLKMFRTEKGNAGFHTKGYIFKNQEVYRIFVGSANLTLNALTKNKEWNTKIVSTSQGEYTQQIVKEFEEFWHSEFSQEFETFIDAYEKSYHFFKKKKMVIEKEKEKETWGAKSYLQPNKMQQQFLTNLNQLFEKNEKRALLISATGTGKTYAAAFGLREKNPKRALFLVHREQIAKQAIKAFQEVFGTSKTFGLLSGNFKEYDVDYLFATMQTMAKDETLQKFLKEAFEFIIIDEVHRAGAKSYQKIMNYFKPQFWLGMTASPERTDGFDIYQLFDHNIVYEIRLQQALEEDLLCPFHYFGITELEVDGEIFDDTTGIRNFSKLVSDQRVNYILEKASFYGYSGERVKGLVFCRSKEEAKELSEKFNRRGYRTVILCGDDSQEKREACIERLVKNEAIDYLDYIFTVDIFNEGVDIPEVNQIIMLRPTESPVVFVQQLGRGLRKSDGKEYVIVLDFIGNYKNNFMIPLALYGDRTYNKDTIRRYVMEGTRIIPGSSTIHFDEISKKRIFESIDKVTPTKKMLTEKYFELKNKLGHIPNILEFYEYGEIDPSLFIDYAKSYHQFVKVVDSDCCKYFTEEEERILEFVSALLVNGKRLHELLLLKMLFEHRSIDKKEFQLELEAFGEKFEEASYLSAVRVLNKEFINTNVEKQRYLEVDFIEMKKVEKEGVRRAERFYEKLGKMQFKQELDNLILYGFRKYKDVYMQHDEQNLVLYQKYSRKDICRLLNWEKDDSSTIYGYRIKYNTCPIFVTYEKKDDISNSTKYEDQFINNRIFSWMTRSRVTLQSAEAQAIINYQTTHLKIYLFIKKSDGEGSDFYYMGRVKPISWREATIQNDKGSLLPIVNFQLELEHAVRTDIYKYFTE